VPSAVPIIHFKSKAGEVLPPRKVNLPGITSPSGHADVVTVRPKFPHRLRTTADFEREN
jgi:hypothetical protein